MLNSQSQHRGRSLVGTLLLALVAIGLAGCGGDPDPPPAPPTPAPVPQPVVVTLGTSEDRITLVPSGTGTWTLNGETFSSGSKVRAPTTGFEYTLTLNNGQWSAAFVAPDPVPIPLGTSGYEANVQQVEDGSYRLNDQPLESGTVVTAGNENQYRLVLSGDEWTAEFVLPDRTPVRLGGSGLEIYLQRLEDGSFEWEGQSVANGSVVTASNASRYRLTLTGTTWAAEFVPPAPTQVQLGQSGLVVFVQRQENGTFELDGQPLFGGRQVTGPNNNVYRFIQEGDSWRAEFVPPPPQLVRLGSANVTVLIQREEQGFVLDGEPLLSGDRRVAITGSTYRFELAPNGTWIATFEPVAVNVQLGTFGGQVAMTTREDGNLQRGGAVFRNGDRVTGSNGYEYSLSLESDGSWRGEAIPRRLSVDLPGAGTSIVVEDYEGQVAIYDGNRVFDGERVQVGGVTYILTQSGSNWSAAREGGGTTPPVTPPTPGDLTTDTLETYEGVRPRLRDEDGRGSSEGTQLDINGELYSLAELFSNGLIEEEDTFVDAARERIAKLKSDIDALLSLSAGGTDLSGEVERRWDDVRDELNDLFPGEGDSMLSADTPKRSNGSIDVADTTDDLNEVLLALQSLGNFEDALERGGIFEDASIRSSDISDVFDAQQSIERIGFGFTQNTRFGAYSKHERDRLGDSLERVAGEGGLGSFAYSPLDRARTADLPSRGDATYRGETIAASGGNESAIYSGAIELSVRLSTRRVAAFVTSLNDASTGEPWEYGSGSVDSIRLPDATLASTAGSFATGSNEVASVIYEARIGSPSPRTVSSYYEGQFVGDNGDAVIGVWDLKSGTSTVLTGAFGAEFVSTAEPVPPPQINDDDGEVSLTSINNEPDRNGDIEIGARDADGDRIELAASDLFGGGGAVIEGDSLLKIASDSLDAKRQILTVYIQIDEPSQSVRTGLWNDANEALEDYVFGSRVNDALGGSYPSGSSLASRDQDALEKLEDAILALSSARRFAESLESGGIFEGLLGDDDDLDDYDFNDIFNAVSYRVTVTYGNSNYTRYGAWAKTARDYAVSESRDDLPPSQDPDVFAYSPLEQAVYSSGDPNFPRDYRATYDGKTMAVDAGSSDPAFYEGDIRLTVEWDNDVIGSAVWAVVSNLEEQSTGDPFQHSSEDVDEILFSGMQIGLSSSNEVEFLDERPTVRIRFQDPFRSEQRFSGTARQEGKFVGYSLNGPLGVIGTWQMGDVKGAYGADIAP